MQSILVPIEQHTFADSIMETALMHASQFNSYIEGIALGPDISDIVVADVPIGGTIFDEKTRREMADESRAQFERFMQSKQVGRFDPKVEAPGYGWSNEQVTDVGLGAYGRVFDLIVVGRPGSGAQRARKATLEAALFESGRPLLIAPPTPPKSMGSTILIAWNASSETARTVAFATAWLRLAKRVIVLTVAGGSVAGGPPGELLATNLKRRGIDAEAVSMDDQSLTTGQAILAKAQQLGADLLIKGGYTQSRLRQMIFGGATSHILAKAELPVFMAH
jgi:nucleotide-binding universal stress UspA family protein